MLVSNRVTQNTILISSFFLFIFLIHNVWDDNSKRKKGKKVDKTEFCVMDFLHRCNSVLWPKKKKKKKDG